MYIFPLAKELTFFFFFYDSSKLTKVLSIKLFSITKDAHLGWNDEQSTGNRVGPFKLLFCGLCF